MNWDIWIPWIAVVVTLLGVWGSLQRQLGKLDARMTSLEQQQREYQAENIRRHEEMQAEYLRLHQETIRMYQEARAENLRLHEETREQIRREIRLVLQVLREHSHADGSPAVTPIPVEADGD